MTKPIKGGVVVLISGRGSNLKAMCHTSILPHIRCVISNKDSASGLAFAKEFSIPKQVVPHTDFNSREEFDLRLIQIIDEYNPQFIILAGFMRILTPLFIKHYTNRIINIHPSILPSFTGAHAIDDAFAAKVKVSGATIHIVTNELDHGPIIAQGIVEVNSLDSIDDLGRKIHQLEHVMYPFIIHKLLKHDILLQSDGSILTKKEECDALWLGKLSNQIYYS